MKITILTDAGPSNQVNGVVTTVLNTKKCLEELGWQVQIIEPENFKTVPYPFYPEITVPINTKNLKKMIRDFDPEYIHIATEAVLGMAGRKFCKKNNFNFTTSYHTKFPEYINDHFHLPEKWGYKYLKWFHSKSSSVMVTTESMRTLLNKKGFKNLSIWGRGVDTDQFKPYPNENKWPKPVFMYVGRLSIEKNIPAFLNLDLPGTKLVVGSGPIENQLKETFPKAVYLGAKKGEELAKAYSQADVFVFPSLTDTYGLVISESLSCGVPVAAYPVHGPIDIIQDGKTGILDHDLRTACLKALNINKQNCLDYVSEKTWLSATKEFIQNLVPIN